MRRLTLLALFLAAPCYALPPANNELTIQPSEIRNWSCNFGVSVSTLVSATVVLRSPKGADADCTTPLGGTTAPWGYSCSPMGLINTPTVSGTTAAFTVTPAGKASGNVYQVDIVVADALGQRFACNGKVTVKTMKVTL